jgi:hypothetical protein
MDNINIIPTELQSGNLKRGDHHLGDFSIDGRIILKGNLKN